MNARRLIELQFSPNVRVRAPDVHRRFRSGYGGGPPETPKDEGDGDDGKSRGAIAVGTVYDYTEERYRLGSLEDAIAFGKKRRKTVLPGDGPPVFQWRGFKIYTWDNKEKRMRLRYAEGYGADTAK